MINLFTHTFKIASDATTLTLFRHIFSRDDHFTAREGGVFAETDYVES